jgi:hypothetical protein
VKVGAETKDCADRDSDDYVVVERVP